MTLVADAGLDGQARLAGCQGLQGVVVSVIPSKQAAYMQRSPLV